MFRIADLRKTKVNEFSYQFIDIQEHEIYPKDKSFYYLGILK
jgi:hypothetical protein